MMSLNLFDGMTQDQALGAVMIGSTALLGIAGLIWAGVESEEKKTKTPVSLRSARVKRPANPLTAHEKRTLKKLAAATTYALAAAAFAWWLQMSPAHAFGEGCPEHLRLASCYDAGVADAQAAAEEQAREDKANDDSDGK